MKLSFFLLYFLVWAVGRNAAGQTSDEKTILQLEKEWCHAYLVGDTAGLAQVMAENYLLTNSRGEISTREDDIQEARSGAVRYTVFENFDMKVRLFDNAAVVMGRTVVKGKAGNNAIDAEFRFTDVFVRQQGRWQAVSGHVTKIK